MRSPRYTVPGDLIAEVGVALYGSHWQRPLARSLGVSDMTVRRWHIQQHTVPGPMAAGMAGLIEARQAALGRAYARLLGLPDQHRQARR